MIDINAENQKVFKCSVGPFQISDAFSVVDLLFEENYLSVSCVEKSEDHWFVEVLSDVSLDLEKIKQDLADFEYSYLEAEELENIDWLQKSFESFKPIIVGQFYIFGPHLRRKERPSDRVCIEIAAATAFGTGEHPTTNRCLKACQTFFDKNLHKKALDVGCGSGILSIALAKLGAESVAAYDNDPEAVRITRENIAINGVGHRVSVAKNLGDEFRLGHYDFAVANILSGPLISLAEALDESLNKNGTLVLSGFNDNDHTVLEKYTSLGFDLRYAYKYKGWTTLVMEKISTN